MTTEKRRAPAGAAVLRGEITTAIRAAVMQELAEVGYGRLSIEAVARRAGVSKTAIYRRWRSKLDLVLDMVTAVAGRRLPLLDTGSLRGDVEVLLLAASTALGHPLASQIIPDLLAEAARNPQIAETLHRAMRDYQVRLGEIVIGRAVARGELPTGADPWAVADLIVGPVYWRLTISRASLDAAQLSTMATAVVAALRVACGGSPDREKEVWDDRALPEDDRALTESEPRRVGA
ncbi:TetR/AcrR family transcriptional regulator [Micromonospora sp. NPDC020750]|uniref:TetR/AcrR family transcriptional regulator n=1 Tax=unclassified Micromonospora TaxID=2617518 RepID=UPI00379DB04E